MKKVQTPTLPTNEDPIKSFGRYLNNGVRQEFIKKEGPNSQSAKDWMDIVIPEDSEARVATLEVLMKKAFPGAELANDPARKDWKFLSTVLGREEVPPRDPFEARNRLRQLLEEAYRERPNHLLRLSLLGNGTGGMHGRIKAFASSLRSEGSEMQTRDSGVRTRYDDAMMEPSWRSAVEYILRNWWKMDFTQDSVTRGEIYKEMGTSTNEPIRSWLPEKAGVVSYLRARTGHILSAYYDRVKERKHTISLDKLGEFKMELSSEGTFVRSIDLSDDFDAGHQLEALEDRAELLSREDANAMLEVSLKENPEGRGETFVKDGVDDPEAAEMQREGLDLRISGMRTEKDAKPNEYADWPLRVFISDYDPSRYSDVEYVRAQAAKLYDRLAVLDKDFAADRDTLVEILNEWDGRRPLVTQIPELDQASYVNRHKLRGLEKIVTKSQEEPATAEEMAIVAPVEASLQGVLSIGNTEEVFKSKGVLGAMALTKNFAEFSEMLESKATDFDLSSTHRPDFEYLASHYLMGTDYKLSPEEMFRQLKEMAMTYFQAQSQARGVNAEVPLAILHSLRGWDPRVELLTEPMTRACFALTAEKGLDPQSETAAIKAKYSSKDQSSFDF